LAIAGISLAARRAAFRILVFRILVAVVALLAIPLASQARAAQTVVSLTFDDAIQNQFANARPILATHGMHGTFFINTGLVAKNECYMTWPQVSSVAADGNEIAGHTVSHPHLNSISAAQDRSEVCDSATTLRSRSFKVTSFAYPHGEGAKNSAVLQALKDCGYTSARKVSGLASRDCGNCPDAETIPPVNKYAILSNDWLDSPLTVSELQRYVTQAEQNGGGWVPLMFHDICSCGASSISASDFSKFLDWLKARAVLGTVVATQNDVMTGNISAPPPVPPPPPPPPPVGPDTTPPTASIASPKPGAAVSGKSVTVTVNASDAGGIADVDLYVDGDWTTWSNSTGSPYSLTWNASSFGKGNHTLRAFVYDKAGNLGKSATVTVNVTG
jgi:peptidoglycan/xylan/chitin deacetylase (PgdA/CDA1 family)